MHLTTIAKIAAGAVGLLALLFAVLAISYNRENNLERKLEVYRAFVSAYSEGHRIINLANATRPFDVEIEAMSLCAPSVFATRLFSRHSPPPALTQRDFPSTAVRVVDPQAQANQVRIHDPDANIANLSDIDHAVDEAFNAGLLQVSDVGFDLTGQHAIFTYSFRCGMLCGHGGTVLLDRVDGRWIWSHKSCGSEWMS